MKPILFSTSMILAILDGRKTMTRRVIKVDDDPENWKKSIAGTSIVRTTPYDVKLPRYAVGNVLWVRETWAKLNNDYHPDDNGKIFIYKADHITGNDGPDLIKWKPSIHMPKEAARIFLRVANVRVERLQDINEEDALKEGCMPTILDGAIFFSAKGKFHALWDGLNAKLGYGWDANPWVWIIEFERTEKPKE